MKKIIAVLLLFTIVFSVWYIGYLSNQNITDGFIMILIWIICSSLGTIFGHFIFNSFLKNYLK